MIHSLKSPIQGNQLVLEDENVPDYVPDKLKPVKPQDVTQTVFVPFTAKVNADSLPAVYNESMTGDATVNNLHLQNNIPVEGLQVAAEPINLFVAESKQCGSTCAETTVEGDSTALQQVVVITTSGGRPSAAPVGDINPCVTEEPANASLQDNNDKSELTVNTNVQAVNGHSVRGAGLDRPTFAQVVNSGNVRYSFHGLSVEVLLVMSFCHQLKVRDAMW